MQNEIELLPIASSNIARIGYDPIDSRLRVEFRNGNIYDYLNVEPELYERLATEPSAGRVLHSTIRPHHVSLCVSREER